MMKCPMSSSSAVAVPAQGECPLRKAAKYAIVGTGVAVAAYLFYKWYTSGSGNGDDKSQQSSLGNSQRIESPGDRPALELKHDTASSAPSTPAPESSGGPGSQRLASKGSGPQSNYIQLPPATAPDKYEN